MSHPEQNKSSHLSTQGSSLSWQLGESVVKASLILKNLSPELTRFTSTCVPGTALSAPPPSVPPSQLTQFPCVAAGASQETRHSQGGHTLTGARWNLKAA